MCANTLGARTVSAAPEPIVLRMQPWPSPELSAAWTSPSHPMMSRSGAVQAWAWPSNPSSSNIELVCRSSRCWAADCLGDRAHIRISARFRRRTCAVVACVCSWLGLLAASCPPCARPGRASAGHRDGGLAWSFRPVDSAPYFSAAPSPTSARSARIASTSLGPLPWTQRCLAGARREFPSQC